MNHTPKVIAFTGGGTGGHVFPAFAVIETLKQRNTPEYMRYIWIGSSRGMEEQLVVSRGIPFFGVPAGKLRRYFSLRNITDLFRIAAGFFGALSVLRRERANVLFSKGGFVSVPPVLAAKLLGIPVISHESDLDPGLATRINMRFSDVLCLAYGKTAETAGIRKGMRTEVTGNPVREEILRGDASEAWNMFNLPADKPLLLVLGGSQGARQVNELIAGAAGALLEDYVIVHQMGSALFQPSDRNNYITAPFFGPELPHLLAAARLVISRSGAGTLWENGVTGTPAILVPLGIGASRGDQLRNAELFAAEGAALILEGKEGAAPDSADLISLVRKVSGDPAVLDRMAEKAGALCNGDAAVKIALIVEEFLERQAESGNIQDREEE
jgi:UDP-N-acetylglucosamine--N-acetylmuramyl-(pentapeptide) pyrophosphoryl-undecaprenol N-acetylglucosamine transferase